MRCPAVPGNRPTRHWRTARAVYFGSMFRNVCMGLQRYVLKAAKPAAGHKVP
jgi:hypothetical protein